jgi:hypothetical protein
MAEILHYEAKWHPNGEWEKCSKSDYDMIVISGMHGHGYPDGSRPEARIIAVVDDPAGLVLEGPKGFATWQAAAIHEKGLRVDLQREIEAVRKGVKAEQKLLAIKKILEDDSDAGIS